MSIEDIIRKEIRFILSQELSVIIESIKANTSSSPTQKYYSIKDLSEYTKISQSKLREWYHTGAFI